jgi:hypothetical protein
MGLTALLPLRKKWCSGFLSPLKIHRPRLESNPRTLGPVASTLTTSPPRSTELYILFKLISGFRGLKTDRGFLWNARLLLSLIVNKGKRIYKDKCVASHMNRKLMSCWLNSTTLKAAWTQNTSASIFCLPNCYTNFLQTYCSDSIFNYQDTVCLKSVLLWRSKSEILNRVDVSEKGMFWGYISLRIELLDPYVGSTSQNHLKSHKN